MFNPTFNSISKEAIICICRLIVIDFNMKSSYVEQLKSPNFLGSLCETIPTIIYDNQISKEKSHICKETFMTISSTIYAQKDYYLINELNSKIKAFNAAGLIQYWHDNSLNSRPVSSQETKTPKIIEMSHLFGCFQLWCIGLALSFIVFSCEVLSKYL
jgi:hypothetical protein